MHTSLTLPMQHHVEQTDMHTHIADNTPTACSPHAVTQRRTHTGRHKHTHTHTCTHRIIYKQSACLLVQISLPWCEWLCTLCNIFTEWTMQTMTTNEGSPSATPLPAMQWPVQSLSQATPVNHIPKPSASTVYHPCIALGTTVGNADARDTPNYGQLVVCLCRTLA